MGRRVFVSLLVLLIPPLAAAQEYPPGFEPEKIDPLDVVAEIGTADLRHGAAITALDFHPDGKLVAAGSADGVIRVWEIETGKCRVLLRDEGPCVRDLRFVKGGKWVRAASCERMPCGKRFDVRRFEVETGRVDSSSLGGFLHTRHTALSPSGDRLVVGIGTYGYPEPSENVKWERKDWEEVRVFGVGDKAEHKRRIGPKGHAVDDRPEITRVALDDGGKAFAAAREGGSLTLWRIGKEPESLAIRNGGPEIADLVFVDGRLLVTFANEGVHGVEVVTGEVTMPAALPGKTLTCARPVRGRLGFVAGAEDGTVTLFEAKSDRWTKDLGVAPVRAVAVSTDGNLIAAGTGDGKIHLLRTVDGSGVTPPGARRAGFEAPVFTLDGKRLLAAQGEEIASFGAESGVPEDRWNPGVGRIAGLTVSGDGLLVTGARGTLVAFDPEGKRRWSAALGAPPGGPYLFDAAGRWILVKVEDGDLALISRKTGEILHRTEVPDESGGAAAFTADGKRFRWTDGARLLTIDGETGERLSNLEIDGYRGLAAFHPTGERVLRLHYTSKVTVHECETGGVLRTIPVQRTLAGFTGIVVSPDGRWVLTGSGPRWVHIAGFMGTSNLHLSDVGKAEYGRGLDAGGWWTHRLGFGPRTRFAWGVTLPKASHVETLRIFSMPDGKLLGGLKRPTLRFATVRISSDGRRAAASTMDRRLFLLRLPPRPEKK